MSPYKFHTVHSAPSHLTPPLHQSPQHFPLHQSQKRFIYHSSLFKSGFPESLPYIRILQVPLYTGKSDVKNAVDSGVKGNLDIRGSLVTRVPLTSEFPAFSHIRVPRVPIYIYTVRGDSDKGGTLATLMYGGLK